MKKGRSEIGLAGGKLHKRNSLRKKLLTTLCVVFSLYVLFSVSGALSLINSSKTSAQTVKNNQPNRAAIQKDEKNISVEALSQIKTLMDEKESRTATERKIDSNLLYAVKIRRGEKITRNVNSLETGVAVDDEGGVSVDIRAQVTDALLRKLSDLKIAVTGVFPEYHSVSAIIKLDEIEKIAGMLEVIFIQASPKGDAGRTSETNQINRTTNVISDSLKINYATDFFKPFGQPSDFEQRAQKARQYLSKQLALFSPQTGSVTSQGDAAHQSNMVRSNIGLNGTNIKIGVLSDGVRTLPDRQASGDLPANVTILPGQAGSGDEGTAMLEIIHDVAPGAQLYFATGATSITRYAQNYKDLRAAGCDIVLDDYFYFVETPFQDGQSPSVLSTSNGGILAQAVSDVANSGAMVFALACNHGNLDDNFSSVYQSDFVDGGTLTLAPGGTVHNFGGGQVYDVVTTASGNPTTLFWSDPLGGSNNDYDLFVLNSDGTAVTRSSTNFQTGTQDPLEQTTAAVAGERIVVLKKTGAADRFFHLTLVANGTGKLSIGTEGAIRGHNTASNVISVAAAPAAARAGGGTAGPFPGAFNSSNVSERFTADGPRRFFFAADGTPFTPANFSSTGGTLRQKPDITAADGVSTTTPGFTTFYGTSAATPHAGALAALIKSASPSLTNAQIKAAIINTAIDIELPGYDRDTGNGIFMPLPALSSLGITTARAVVNKGTTVISEAGSGSDGDGRVEPGENGNLLIQTLQNVGAANATGVTATLSTNTPGVTITPSATLPFSDIAAGGTSAPNTQPYTFALSSSFACGTPIDFLLTVNYAGGGSSQQLLNFTVDTNTSTIISSTLDTVAPTTGANYTASTGLQNLRVNRAGGGTSCTVTKPFPGTFGTGTRQYDAYTFTATNSGCMTIALNQTTMITSNNSIFSTVYGNGGFDPNNIATNYLADLGLSPELANRNYYTYAFNAVAGQQFTVVVNEVNSGGAAGVNYTVTVSGASNTVCNAVTTAAAASVSGIVTANGRGLANARVNLTGVGGTTRTAVTNSFGYFKLTGVDAAATYIVNVTAKRYSFAPQIISVTDNISGMVLTAQ